MRRNADVEFDVQTRRHLPHPLRPLRPRLYSTPILLLDPLEHPRQIYARLHLAHEAPQPGHGVGNGTVRRVWRGRPVEGPAPGVYVSGGSGGEAERVERRPGTELGGVGGRWDHLG